MKISLPILLLAASGLPAQTPFEAQALLAEVRQLRVAMERLVSLTPRVQLTLQRLQLQQDHVLHLSRQLEDLRDEIAAAGAEESRMLSATKGIETCLSQESDAARRKLLDEEMKELRTQLEAQSEHRRLQLARQQARESELAGRLYAEQGKMNELFDRLNSLERQLELPPK
jgi:hypothetical protein